MNTEKPPLQMNLARYFSAGYHPGDALPPPGRAVIDYITAGNGIWKRAASELFMATIPVVETRPCRIPGLRNLEPFLLMRYGLIPAQILMRAIGWSRAAMPNEAMFHVRYGQDRFWLAHPTQQRTPGGVDYVTASHHFPIVMDIHSHHTMRACFSATDDRDELGFRLYCTLGHLHASVPEVAIRLGVYGDWFPLRVGDVFDFGPAETAARVAAAFVEDVHEH